MTTTDAVEEYAQELICESPYTRDACLQVTAIRCTRFPLAVAGVAVAVDRSVSMLEALRWFAEEAMFRDVQTREAFRRAVDLAYSRRSAMRA